MKQTVIAMKMHCGEVKVATYPEPLLTKIGLPDGCVGMLFVFESKKKAREYWGKDVELLQIEKVENK